MKDEPKLKLDANKTPTVKAVEVHPTTTGKEEMMTIKIDPEMVGKGGIRVNGKLFIGEVTVPISQARDLLRIQEEYYETVKKLLDKNVVVRMKNDFQKEALFLADPHENEGRKGFSRDYGMLPRREWELCNDELKKQLLEKRKQLYNY